MEKRYRIVEPSRIGGFQKEWQDCLQQLAKVEEDGWSIFRIAIFINATNDKDWQELRSIITNEIKRIYQHQCPPTTIVAQPPRDNQVTMEIGYVKTEATDITYNQLDGLSYIIIKEKSYKEIWIAGAGDISDSTKIEESAVSAFESIKKVLAHEGFNFDHIVRQWNYIANILDYQQKDHVKQQHYQIFNEVRNLYYQKHRKIEGYPAATGIGTRAGGVVIDCCAVDCNADNCAISINNPLQCTPYSYSQSLLEGEVPDGKQRKQAPQFERAKLISNSTGNILYISGTASIRGEETIGINDVEAQTRNTIKYIKELSSQENIKSQYDPIEITQSIVKNLRVYVKNKNDIDVVRTLCQKEFDRIPIITVIADVCRKNLLVEIEAEYFFEK